MSTVDSFYPLAMDEGGDWHIYRREGLEQHEAVANYVRYVRDVCGDYEADEALANCSASPGWARPCPEIEESWWEQCAETDEGAVAMWVIR